MVAPPAWRIQSDGRRMALSASHLQPASCGGRGGMPRADRCRRRPRRSSRPGIGRHRDVPRGSSIPGPIPPARLRGSLSCPAACPPSPRPSPSPPPAARLRAASVSVFVSRSGRQAAAGRRRHARAGGGRLPVTPMAGVQIAQVQAPVRAAGLGGDGRHAGHASRTTTRCATTSTRSRRSRPSS